MVCGHPVNHKYNLVCLLPGNVNHTTHVSLAVAEGNTLVLAFRKAGQKETEWQPVVSDQPEQSMSRERQ